MWLCGWDPLILSPQLAKFWVHRPCEIRDNAFDLSRDHVVDVSRDFVGEVPSS